MDCTEELHQLAAKCRRIADALSDGEARTSLLELADEYERRAACAEGPRPVQRPASKIG